MTGVMVEYFRNRSKRFVKLGWHLYEIAGNGCS
ncbi:Uncharacterised protein [Segatella copri]|nr:Uncharacterised protein [Segatella copri]